MWLIEASCTTFWKDCLFLIELLWYLCQKSVYCLCVGLFLVSFFYSIVIFIIFTPITNFLPCCNYISLEVRRYKSSSYLFPFLTSFDYSSSFVFSYKFQNQCSCCFPQRLLGFLLRLHCIYKPIFRELTYCDLITYFLLFQYF